MSFEIAAPDVEADAVLAAALDPETFDVFEFVSNVNLPTDTEIIYTDADAAIHISKLLEDKPDEDSEDVFGITEGLDDDQEQELSDLHRRLVASSLEFTFQGIAPALRKALENKLKATTEYSEGADNEAYWEQLTAEVAARSIKKVEHVGSGRVDNSVWTTEKVDKFVETLYPTEQAKFFAKAMELTYVKSEVFDRAVHADFS